MRRPEVRDAAVEEAGSVDLDDPQDTTLEHKARVVKYFCFLAPFAISGWHRQEVVSWEVCVVTENIPTTLRNASQASTRSSTDPQGPVGSSSPYPSR